MSITGLEQLLEIAKGKPRKKIIVAYGQDVSTIRALNQATDMGIIKATLIGNRNNILKVCSKHQIDSKKFEIIHQPDEMKAGREAVLHINQGDGDFIMKGLISTDNFLRCILDKEKGILLPKTTLMHISITKPPAYHKILLSSDSAFFPKPDINQKLIILNYLVDAAHKLGIDKPKVAIISFTEKINPKIESLVDAAILAKMSDRGQIQNAYVDGPLAMDVAVDTESVQTKSLKSSVAGDADCLLFPNLESGNVYYKVLSKLAKFEMASYVAGAKVPTVITSRGDTLLTKLYSLTFAALMAERK